jgi:aryl-alcohol dehydrogenase-like predicted oxidoreductase
MKNSTFSKIALGTVRFGMDYGISDRSARIRREDAFEIMEKAMEAGIDVVDTAHGYGESERVIGCFLKTGKRTFRVVSKLPKCARGEVARLFRESLDNLGTDALYGYLVHSFENYKNDEGIWEELCKLRSEGKAEKIGFSLYYPSQLEELFDKKVSFDIVQIPCNILDQRFSPYLQPLKKRGVEVHARSVFLQGLLLKEPTEVAEGLKGVSGKLEALRSIAHNSGISIEALCLLFVASNPGIDRVVIGMGSTGHVKSNIEALKDGPGVRGIYDELVSLKEDNEDITVPSRWEL